jgi:hypothetical protein
MSTPDQYEIPRISSVKIDENSKQEPGIKIHVYVGTTDEDMNTARDQAIRVYEETRAAVRG